LKRWLRFHVSTGTISVLTNVGVTLVVMDVTGLPVVPSNVIAVALGSLASFWINDRLVFRPAPVLEKSADARVPANVP
jgi:putative flippase GtrA